MKWKNNQPMWNFYKKKCFLTSSFPKFKKTFKKNKEFYNQSNKKKMTIKIIKEKKYKVPQNQLLIITNLNKILE